MIKKTITSLLLLSTFIFANPTVTASQPFDAGAINVYVTPTGIGAKDWIAIYPKNASNSWNNVITWKWVKDLPKGNVPRFEYHDASNITQAGNYQVRYFKNNTFTTYKAFDFIIKDTLNLNFIEGIYNNGKLYLTIHLKHMGEMLGNGPKDWVGLYKKGDSNAWGNVITWAWAKDFHPDDDHGTQTVLSKDIELQNGMYEVRYFKDNSFTTFKKSESFTVGEGDIGLARMTAHNDSPNKVSIYLVGNHGYAKPNPEDWIGIYEKGVSNAWGNVLAWVWAKDVKNIETEGHSKYITFPVNLERNREYDARYFLNNSFETYRNITFKARR